MAIQLYDFMANLPVADQEAIRKRAAELIAEEATLRQLREAEFDQYLLGIGLMTQLPDTASDFDDPNDQPIDIRGEPLSETVIRERR